MKHIVGLCGFAASSALASVALIGCAGSASPLSPTATSSSGAGYTVSGIVSAINGGEPLADIALTSSTQTVTTDSAGAFELRLTGVARALPVTISGPSIVTRTTTLGSSASTLNPLSVFREDGSFDLSFYRAFARNGFEQPSQLQPIRRWTQAPQIYLKTVDEAGRPIDDLTLETTAAALASAAEIWTGGLFKLAGITRGRETREGTSGWITVKWANPPAAGRCGLSQIATDGGWIELNYLGATCSCGGASRIYPRVVRHELGHALGYFHTDSPNDVMYGQPITANACDLHPSARERQYAQYVYSRPVGNTDPDNDPVGTAPNTRRALETLVQP